MDCLTQRYGPVAMTHRRMSGVASESSRQAAIRPKPRSPARLHIAGLERIGRNTEACKRPAGQVSDGSVHGILTELAPSIYSADR